MLASIGAFFGNLIVRLVIGFVLLLIFIVLLMKACGGDDVRIIERTVTDVATTTDTVTVTAPVTTVPPVTTTVPDPTLTAPTAPTTPTVTAPPPPPDPPEPPTFYPQLDGQVTPVGTEGSQRQLRNLGAQMPDQRDWRSNPYGQTYLRVGNEPLFAHSMAEGLGTATSFTRSGLHGLINEDGSWNELGNRFVTAMQHKVRERWMGEDARLPSGPLLVMMAVSEREMAHEIHDGRTLRVDGPLANFASACGQLWVDRRGNIYWQCQQHRVVTRSPSARSAPAPRISRQPARRPASPAPRPRTVAPAPDPVTPDQWAPTVRFVNPTHEIYVNGQQRFCAAGSDRNGDRLTYAFGATAGHLTEQHNNCVDYTAPGTPGLYTLTASVSDGHVERSVDHQVKVIADDFGQP